MRKPTLMESIAENSLMQKIVADYLNENLRLETKHLTYGDGTTGSYRLKSNLTNFINNYFNPIIDVQPREIIVSSGVSGTLDQLIWTLCNEGDGILVGKPVYSGFIKDFYARSRANAVPVSFGAIDPFSIQALQCYEQELVKFNNEHTHARIQAVLLANPHNPLGRCYPRETLVEYLKFCEKHDIHLIADEIYAMSIFRTSSNNDAVEFQSVLSINMEDIVDPMRVHVLYGMSKDFSSNGLRLGLVVSRNPQLVEAMSSITIFSWPSAPADLAWCIMLEDTIFLEYYISEHQKRLGEGYEFLAGILDNLGIDYARGSNAGFFLWVDLSFALEQPEDGSEPGLTEDMRLDQKLIQNGVHLAAGLGYQAEKPGWFRMTFSQPRPLLLKGLTKMMRLLKGVDLDILAIQGLEPKRTASHTNQRVPPSILATFRRQAPTQCFNNQPPRKPRFLPPL
ncbi:hypothetical protein AOL_s00076g403 [Orbilia oligospora ATCC 24927]|uniref:Aminotransferase class I/classII large domain-containing protein n=1 Tax=Arthrobotrys oligospora (strain ATCC 24927 / CBS 115.81 / DSM 1491) TaxID=756982 RepID=G1X9R4_ARTOA|nr:hypothetical protein AOL_s00076g403 [Orbilia oligospora ATCC 24927]EGX50052.1 hypothetical protein AOL_s00076g403 [Orbilia oligospora ATCC 24927]